MLDFGGLLQDMLSKFMQGVPNVLSAIFIFLIGYIVAKLLAKAVRKMLEAIHIDKIGDKLNEIDLVNKTNIEIKFSAVLSKIFYYFTLLFFMVAATDVLNMPAISNLVASIFNLLPNLLVAGIILIVGVLFADMLRGLIKTACESLGIPSAKMISMMVFYFIVINVLVSALTQAKINTEFLSQNISLIIGGAILAFAIGYGLASKDSVANFLASQYLQDKVKVGDFITVDGVTGQVIGMDRSAAVVETEAGKMFIPLNQLSNNKVEVRK